MKNEICIEKPYLLDYGDSVRLCADLKRPVGDFTFWFEVPKQYKEYLCKEFDSVYEKFVNPKITDKPMLFELFTNSSNERQAFDIISNIDTSAE